MRVRDYRCHTRTRQGALGCRPLMSNRGSLMLWAHVRRGRGSAVRMSELSAQKAGRKKDWPLTEGAFQRLLGWLDEGADSDGQKYLEMLRRLVSYFDRKNCSTPDELADETLNRVARRLEEEGSIETDAPARYCYTVARHAFMEHLRGPRQSDALVEQMRRRPHGDEMAESETRARRAIRET